MVVDLLPIRSLWMRDDSIPYQLRALSRNSLKPYYLKIVITYDSDSRCSRWTFCQYLYEKFALRNLLLFIIVAKISSTAPWRNTRTGRNKCYLRVLINVAQRNAYWIITRLTRWDGHSGGFLFPIVKLEKFSRTKNYEYLSRSKTLKDVLAVR